MTNVSYADDLALLSNIPTQAESFLCDLKEATSDIGLYVNSNVKEFLCF